MLGSPADMEYYSEVNPWYLNGQKVKVTVDNDHLGQVDQELKNIESHMDKGRKNLFALRLLKNVYLAQFSNSIFSEHTLAQLCVLAWLHSL